MMMQNAIFKDKIPFILNLAILFFVISSILISTASDHEIIERYSEHNDKSAIRFGGNLPTPNLQQNLSETIREMNEVVSGISSVDQKLNLITFSHYNEFYINQKLQIVKIFYVNQNVWQVLGGKGYENIIFNFPFSISLNQTLDLELKSEGRNITISNLTKKIIIFPDIFDVPISQVLIESDLAIILPLEKLP